MAKMTREDVAELKKAIQESNKDMMPQVVAQVMAAVAPKDPPSTSTTTAKGVGAKKRGSSSKRRWVISHTRQ